MRSISPILLDNQARLDRISQLHNEKAESYEAAVAAAMDAIGKDGTIKYHIQRAALALEEIYMLHDQAWMIQQIGSIIVQDLRTRGFKESKYKYVYFALKEYGDKFYCPVEQSYSQSVQSSTKRQEIFYRTNAKRYYEALATLKEMRNDYDNLLVRDIQTIVPDILSEYDYHEKYCKEKKIIFEKGTQDGFESGPDKFPDPIHIKKPTARVPQSMAEELNTWINTFLPALLKKFTEYPISDLRIEKRMAAGWAALRHAHDPSTDDKYRKSYYDWIQIVGFADQSFKHHAAKEFKTKDFAGRWRKLTREQIGARQKTIPVWCKWFFEKFPGFMEEIAWCRMDREPSLAEFSINLGPKLSDKSMR